MQGKDICFLQVSQLSSGVWWAVYQQAWKAASGSIPLTSPAGTSRSLQFFITMLKSHFQAIIWQIWGMMQSKINELTRCFMQVQCYEGGFSSWLDEHSKLCWMDTLVRSRLCLLACWGSRLKGSNRVHKLICKGSKTGDGARLWVKVEDNAGHFLQPTQWRAGQSHEQVWWESENT